MKIKKRAFNFFDNDKRNNTIYMVVQIILTISICTTIFISFKSDNDQIKKLKNYNEKNLGYENIEDDNSINYKIKAYYLDYIYNNCNNIYLTSINAQNTNIIITGKSFDIESIKIYCFNLQNEKFKNVQLDNIKKVGEEYLFEVNCMVG